MMKKELNIDFFKIQYNNIEPKKGRILISEPFSSSFYFKRSVILLTEHDKDGSVGYILNKPVEVDFDKMFTNFPDINIHVSLGGPVNTDRIYYLHTLGKDLIPGSIRIVGNIYWGGNFNLLLDLLRSGAVKEWQVKFFVGYSGWSENQLADEISKNYWLVSELSATEIMDSSNDIWKLAVSKLAPRYRIWANFPEDASLN